MSSIYVSLTWGILILASLVFAKRQRHSGPWSSFRGSFFLIAVEVAIVGVTFQTGVIQSSNYLIVVGSLFMIAGWIVSYQRLLRLWLRHLPRISQVVFSVVLGTRQRTMGVHVQSLLGDWFQLVGLTLVWASPYAFVLALIVVPILTRLVIRWRKDQRADSEKSKKQRISLLREVYLDFGFLVRIAFIAVLPAVLGSIVARERVLFGGTTQEAVSLLTTLIQVEATVGALVTPLLFLLVELTTSAYSPRLARLLTVRSSFKILVPVVILGSVPVTGEHTI